MSLQFARWQKRERPTRQREIEMSEQTPDTRTFEFAALSPTLATAMSHGIGTDGPEQVVYFGICSPAQPLAVGRVVSVRREGRTVTIEETLASGMANTLAVLSATSTFWAAPVPPAPEAPQPDPAKVVEVSTEIQACLDDAQRRADEGALAVGMALRHSTPTIDSPPVLDELREIWVGWRAERHYRVDGVDRRLSAVLASSDWRGFAARVYDWLTQGRRVAAIRELREWVRTGPHATVGLAEARDWVDAYRTATGPVRLDEVPDGAVVRFPDSLVGEVVVTRVPSAFPGRLVMLTTDVETGKQAWRYALLVDTAVTVLSGPPSEALPASLDAI